MGHRRSNIDWYNVFLSAFSHDGAVDDSSDSPAPAPQAPASPGGRQSFPEPRNEFERRFGPGAQVDEEPHFRLTRPRPAAKAAVGLGTDVSSASKGVFDFSPMDEDEQGGHVSHEHCSKLSPKSSGQKKNNGKATVGLGPDVPFTSKGVSDFSPMDEDEQGEHVSLEQYSKSSPKISGQKKKKKNCGQEPLNKKKSQGHGGKRKPSVNKRKAQATDPEESDYESSLPRGFSERRKQQLQNSSSVRKVQDVILLDDDDDDEDMEPKEEVNHEMSDRLNEPKIYYPSRDDQEAVVLTKSDIKCLDPEGFLSSSVINFYIKYIERTRLCNENFRDKFYIFNTYFFGNLEKAMYQPCDFPKLRRWWKGVNIFNNAYIILPIHKKEHWSLVIICLPPKEKVSEPIILHLDSLEMHRSTILNTVGRYLEKEWRFLSVAEPGWPCLLTDIRKETVKVPQQNSAYDCGIFMLYYIEQFIKEAPARFTTDKLGMFNRSWFKPEEASGLRQRIRELLLEELESARLDQCCRISVADSRERIKGIKVLASEEANMESGYPAKSMQDIVDVADSIKDDKEGTVKADSGSSEPEKEGKSIVTASPQRLKGAEEVMGSTPIPDVVSDNGVKRLEGNEEVIGGSSMPIPDAVCDSGVKRSEGNEEVIGGSSMPNPDEVCDSGVKRSEGNEEAIGGSSMPIPDAVCEDSGTKMWITRVYRPTSGTTLEPSNWCWSSGGSRRDARRAFIEHFCPKK